MVTIKVIATKGWQTGDKLYSHGFIGDVDATVERLQPYVDAEIIEIVSDIKTITPEDDAQKYEDMIVKVAETVGKQFNDAIGKMANVANPSFRVHDNVDDDPKSGFKSMSDFATAVYRADHREHAFENTDEVKRIRELDTKNAVKTTGHMSEGDPTQGGHLVPEEFRNTLLQTAIEDAIVRPRATFIPMATNSVRIPALSDYDHRTTGSGIFGAVKIFRPGEAGQKTASKPEFDLVQLNLHKKIILTYVSDELMEDSPISIGPLLTNLMGRAIAWKDDNDFINGTGANMPLGILNAPATITVTRTASDPYIVYADVVNMWSRLHPASMSNSIWLVNNALLPFLLKMCGTCQDNEGSDVSASTIPVYIPGNSAAETPFAMLLGRPVIVTEHANTLGSPGDIILADFSQYLIGGKPGQGTTVDTSIHLRFDFDETAFRAVMRDDGKPWWNSTLIPKHGDSSTTLSPFVILGQQS